jgi:hypothetical protein
MDAFEEIVAGIFRHSGYWVHQSYKVRLTAEQKRMIGKPSMPRPEIDILGYKPRLNTLLWIECKSFLDSFGVAMLPSGHVGDDSTRKDFWLFSNNEYRRIVSEQLCRQVYDDGLVLENPPIKLEYALVVGHVKNDKSRQQIHEQFQQEGWHFYDENWIQEEFRKLAELGYENDVAIIVAKLLGRAKVRDAN